MQDYVKGPLLGEGTYGCVFRATHTPSGRAVAVKKVRLRAGGGGGRPGAGGLSASVLRELKALRALAGHEHVVELLDVFATKSSLVLVFEHMDGSLEDLIADADAALSAGDVKALMAMLLAGLAGVHAAGYLHRDVKPDNLLLSGSGLLKLADFGLARSVDAPSDDDDGSGGGASSSSAAAARLTPQVFGRWYCPPELLMGASEYGPSVDVWAAGVVLGELLLRRPWFPGSCDLDQLDRIFKALGVPNEATWPGLAALPHRVMFSETGAPPLEQQFPQASPDCLDLLRRMLEFNPDARISAADALAHPYFSSSPPPTPAGQLPKPRSSRGRGFAAASVPALMQDLLMRPAMMLRQQQQQHAAATGAAELAAPLSWPAGSCGPAAAAAGGGGGGGAGPSRPLFAFAPDAPSFSGRVLAAGQQQGLLGLAAPLGGSRLRRASSSDELGAGPAAEQASAGSAPWKGRLSFGAAADELAAVWPPGGEAAAAADMQQQQQQQQQQQPASLRRPSPSLAGGGQGAMRPPLHRVSSSHCTPVLAGGSGGVDGQAAAAGVVAGAGGRRRVSDLAAALSSAAAAAAAADASGALPSCTPWAPPGSRAGMAVCQSGGAAAPDDGEAACPMSLGTSAHKRSRAVFEAPPAEGQQQQQHAPAASLPAAPPSCGRRLLHSRRSSTGCCSMDTDAGMAVPAGAAAAAAAAAGVTAAGSCADAGSGWCGGCNGCQQHQQQREAHAGCSGAAVPAAAAAGGAQKQQELEWLLAAGAMQAQQSQHDQQQQELHASQQGAAPAGSTAAGPGGAVLQLLQPWAHAAAAAAGAEQQCACADCRRPPSQQQQPSQQQHRGVPRSTSDQQLGSATSAGPPSCCPMSLDTTRGPAAVAAAAAAAAAAAGGFGPAGFGPHVLGGSGAAAAGGGLVCSGGNLALLDPADLAELARWWRPRLDSAERAYLRCRKLQMDEALLQASQPEGGGDDDGPDCHLMRSPDSCPRGALFGMPTPAKGQAAGAAQQLQHQQAAGMAGTPPVLGVAAAAAAAAPAGPPCSGWEGQQQQASQQQAGGDDGAAAGCSRPVSAGTAAAVTAA